MAADFRKTFDHNVHKTTIDRPFYQVLNDKYNNRFFPYSYSTILVFNSGGLCYSAYVKTNGGTMFGHDKHDDDKNEDVVQPVSTQPVNEGLLGVKDDDDDNAVPVTVSNDSTDDDALAESEGVNPEHTNLDGHPDGEDPTSTPPVSGGDDLLDIKRQALQELSPLVDHLDQSPEEKFKTTMMMIQATDDKSLLPEAFNAAKGIADDKTRAQALLDIINEINYFTQPKKD
jgi:hypothetical protein